MQLLQGEKLYIMFSNLKNKTHTRVDTLCVSGGAMTVPDAYKHLATQQHRLHAISGPQSTVQSRLQPYHNRGVGSN